MQTNIIFHNNDKKHFVITAPRIASTKCRSIFTTINGWEILDRPSESYDLEYLKDQYDQGAEFYVLCREPTKRLMAAFDMVSPLLRELPHDNYNNLSSFSGVILHQINKFGPRELQRYGYMNYCLSDNHMAWGNSIYGLFLESVGIKTKLLYLDTDAYAVTDQFNMTTWGPYQKTLDNYFKEHYPDQMPRLGKGEKPVLLRQIKRNQRLDVYLSLFGGAVGCFFDQMSDGRIPPSNHNKFYSVFDWMNDERNAYWGLGSLKNISPHADAEHDLERVQQARKILVGILKNMTDKILMENVCHDFNQRSTLYAGQMGFPVCTMVHHIYHFHKWSSNHSELLPEIYKNASLWTDKLD